MVKANGYVLYDGPSMLDGKPIVMIVNCVERPSKNEKTGSMLQTWILRSDIHPSEAIANGDDESICGQCPRRHGASGDCYVLERTIASVWQAYKRGTYPHLHEFRMFERRAIRIGSYGDPAAVPVELIADLVRHTRGHTAYTHQWRTCDQRLRDWCMASTDSVDDFHDAQRGGWRSYRVRAVGDTRRVEGESVCPGSADGGYKLTCIECMACAGAGRGRRADIVVSAHGSRSVQFARRDLSSFRGIPIRRAA
jgi:hypothetical protein